MIIYIILSLGFSFILFILLLHTDFPSPVCAWLTFYRSLVSFIKTGQLYPLIDGCDYVENMEPTPDNVESIKCKRCGKYSTSWTWGTFKNGGDNGNKAI